MTPLLAHADRAGSKETAARVVRGSLPGIFLMVNTLETGGSERQFAALATALDRSLFRVHLGCVRRRGSFLDLGEIPQFPLGGSLYGVSSWRARAQLARHVRKCGTAIAHAFDFYTNLALIPAARLARIPVVVGSQRQLGDLLTPWQFRVQLAAFHCCDHVVCNSQAAADHLMDRGLPAGKVSVIPNGIALAMFASPTPAFPRSPGLVRVGMVARMNHGAKNHRSLLAAAARLRGRFSLEFLLVGDGPLRTELEQHARELGVSDMVRFLGQREDIPAVLASLDISVLPSSSESLSNTVIESMAAGVPVVATSVGGNRELLADSRGVLVEPGSSDSLASGIERLLGNPELRREMGRRAKQFAKTNFEIGSMQQKYQDLYQDLLAQKNWKPVVRARGPETSKGRLRVAVVAASLRYVGGQSVQADLLVRHWQTDPAVQAAWIPIDPDLPKFLAWCALVPGLRTLVREPFYLFSLWRGLRESDVAHIFSASYWSFLIAPVPAWAVARLLGKKTLIHYHSGEARDHLHRFPTAPWFLKRADRLVVPSPYLVKVFQEFKLESEAIPNIVDLSQFSFRLRHPLRPHLVCTRGFHPYYAVDVVVRAFARVKQKFPQARLDLVGKGPTEQHVRDLVQQLGLADVHFHGVVSRREIGKFYDQADIFINGSHLDNMPVSVLEAFAAGTPVVTTAPEGMAYIVEHERTGLLSEPGDAEGLADNVLRLLNEQGLAAELAENAWMESKGYAWPAVRERWLDIYSSLASADREFIPDGSTVT